MKFMKLGSRPDIFYTKESIRAVNLDIPSDLVVQLNGITFHLHKQLLLPKCGLLQRICSDPAETGVAKIDLHDIPGGEDAFELCAKFCYGIKINLSAHNFVSAFCAAKYLQMTESIEKGNFILKLESFFSLCILEGWKDPIITLQTTSKVFQWSENLGIIRRCMDSIVEKILCPLPKVTWSYTYTRPGYDQKQHHSVPKDWWTEDISELDIELFRSVVIAIKSTNMLQPQLIGEACHVYACRWLPDIKNIRHAESSSSQIEEGVEKNRRVLETITTLIPSDYGSVSTRFLLRLLAIANFIGASPGTKAELVRRGGIQFEDATLSDLLLHTRTDSDRVVYDIDLVATVLDSYLVLWKRVFPSTAEDGPLLRSIRKVGKLIDSYLQVVAKDANVPVSKVVSLAEALPQVARTNHDDLYKAIDIYLKEHPDLIKTEKKRLCRILDCQKLSPEVRVHAVKNERLPLRTVVQVLFFEQEKGVYGETSHKLSHRELLLKGQQSEISEEDLQKLNLGPDDRSSTAENIRLSKASEEDHQKKSTASGKLKAKSDSDKQVREVSQVFPHTEREIQQEVVPGKNLDTKRLTAGKTGLNQAYNKGRDR